MNILTLSMMSGIATLAAALLAPRVAGIHEGAAVSSELKIVLLTGERYRQRNCLSLSPLTEISVTQAEIDLGMRPAGSQNPARELWQFVFFEGRGALAIGQPPAAISAAMQGEFGGRLVDGTVVAPLPSYENTRQPRHRAFIGLLSGDSAC